MAAVATLWTSLLLAAGLADFDLLGEEPLSYLGTRPRSALLFSGGLLAGAALLTAFHGWVRAHFPVARGFSTAMLGGLAAQAVAAVVPIGGNGPAHRVHTTFALLLGASLPLLMWRFAAGQRAGRGRRLAYALFWLEVVACVVGFALSGRSVAALAEILPAMVFHAWIATVTFLLRP